MVTKEQPIEDYVKAAFIIICLGFVLTILPIIADSTNREYLIGEKFGIFLMTIGAVFAGIAMSIKIKNQKA